MGTNAVGRKICIQIHPEQGIEAKPFIQSKPIAFPKFSASLGLTSPQFTLDLVRKRLDSPTESRDMLNAFLQVHKADPERLSLREVTGAAYINV